MARDAHFLTDIRLTLLHAGLRPVYAVATDVRRVPTQAGPRQDLGVVDGIDNMAQAVVMRLLTPMGELSPLGHPEYGSRLHSLVGERNTETNRNLIRLFILESLALEPRVEEVLDVRITPNAAHRTGVDVTLVVRPAAFETPVRIGPFSLEVEA